MRRKGDISRICRSESDEGLRKPWQTTAWRMRRADFIKGKSCEWCGSDENLAISHNKRDFDPKKEEYRVAARYFQDYFNNEQHIEEFNKLKEQAQAGVKLYYYDSCPSCGYGSVYSRSDKYCRTKKVPKFKCSKCKTEFQESVKKLKRSSEAYLRRRFFDLFTKEHGEKLTQLYVEHMETLNEDYLQFKDVKVLCRRCHFAYHKGLNLCPVCKTHYKRPRFEMCWECFKKTERGKEVIKEREEIASEKEVPLIDVTLPCLEEVRVYEDQFEYGGIIETCMHQCPFPDIGGDVNSCEAFIQYKKEEDEAVEAAFR